LDHIRGFIRTCRTHRRRKDPRLLSRNGFRPFISNCGAALSRRASRASWSGRLLDDASDQYRRPASHWPLLLGAVENRPGDDGQEEARGRRRKRAGGPRGWETAVRTFLPSFHHPSTASGHSLQAPFGLRFLVSLRSFFRRRAISFALSRRYSTSITLMLAFVMNKLGQCNFNFCSFLPCN